MMRNFFSQYLFCLFLLVQQISFGQQPYSFNIGENDLATVDIYSLLYDDEKLMLYAATDQGLFSYHRDKFVQSNSVNEQKGASLFDLKKGPNGIYVKNLRGQLFKFNEQLNQLELIFELSKDKLGVSFWYFFSGNKLWLITTNSISSYKIVDGKIQFGNEQKHFTSKFLEGFVIDDCSTLNHNKILISSGKSSHYILLTEGKLELKNTHFPKERKHQYFELDNQIYFADITGTVSELESGKIAANYDYNEFFQSINSNLVIGRSQTNGIHILKPGFSSKTKKVFEDKFVSAVTANNSGTIFFGTFKNGIIVVPNLENKEYTVEKELFTSVCVEKEHVYVSTRNGKIIELTDNHFSTIYENRENLDNLFLAPFELGEISSQKRLIHIPSKNIINPKDACVVNDSTVLIAQYDRIISFTSSFDRGNVFKIIASGKRFTSVAFSHELQNIYYANNSGFYVTPLNQFKPKEIKVNNKSLVVNDILCVGNEVWVATQELGLIIFLNEKEIRRLDQNSGIKSNNIIKIEKVKHQFYILTPNGLSILSQNSEISTLGVNEGVFNPNIIDFVVKEDRLYLLYKSSLVIVPQLNKNKNHYQPPLIKIDSVKVNQKRLIDDELLNLVYNENNISIYFDLRVLEQRNETQLFYKLEPIHKDWVEIKEISTGEINFTTLASGNYTFQLMAKTRKQESVSKKLYFKIDQPFWFKWWFMAIVLLIIILFVSVYFRKRLINQRLKLEAINQINASKITAIQSQMNPHFIFNALNSIQALVLKGDTDNSYGFINKFSHLMRRTLNNSEKEAISLDEELDLLTHYLELEKLRFREDFSYSIDCDIDEDLFIPPMLIQPFVENSIIHGLLPKEGFKSLAIRFERKNDEIHCIVMDNGVGRAKAKENSQRRNHGHKSFATRSIDNRLRLLKQKFGNKLGYNYEDILNSQGHVTGTKLMVVIPTMNVHSQIK